MVLRSPNMIFLENETTLDRIQYFHFFRYAHFEKFKHLYKGWWELREASRPEDQEQDKFVFYKFKPHYPKNQKYAGNILQEIVSWLYTGKISITHEIKTNFYNDPNFSKDNRTSHVKDQSPMLEELYEFGKTFDSHSFKELVKSMKMDYDSDIKQMNEDFEKEHGSKSGVTFDSMSFAQRLGYIFHRSKTEGAEIDEEHKSNKNLGSHELNEKMANSNLFNRFCHYEQRCGRSLAIGKLYNQE